MTNERDKKLMSYATLWPDTMRCHVVSPAENGARTLRGTFLGLIRGEEGVVAVVHFDGEPLLDMVETKDLTLEEE
jgi:hypothetical protein